MKDNNQIHFWQLYRLARSLTDDPMGDDTFVCPMMSKRVRQHGIIVPGVVSLLRPYISLQQIKRYLALFCDRNNTNFRFYTYCLELWYGCSWLYIQTQAGTLLNISGADSYLPKLKKIIFLNMWGARIADGSHTDHRCTAPCHVMGCELEPQWREIFFQTQAQHRHFLHDSI